MVTHATIPHRLAALVEPEVSKIELIDTHITRRRVCEQWPRTNRVSDLPRFVRVTVKLPAGIYVKVQVNLMLKADWYIYANADPYGRCRGEDPDASGAFPVECEVAAERMALEGL